MNAIPPGPVRAETIVGRRRRVAIADGRAPALPPEPAPEPLPEPLKTFPTATGAATASADQRPAEAAEPGAAGVRLALLSAVGFWAFYFATNTLRMFVTDMPAQLDMAGRRAIVSIIGIGLTMLLYSLLRRLEGGSTRRMVTAVFLAAVPLSMAWASVNRLLFYVIAPNPAVVAAGMPHMQKIPPILLIVDQAVEYYFFIVAWGILWIAIAHADRVRRAERRATRYQAEAQTAQLRALRYQINPHFLFNTLNSLSALVLGNRNDAAEKMILNLSAFFRTSLTSDTAADVRLADEIALQRLYLDIERVRFPERLRVSIEVPDALADVMVPGLLLQPLVENAIKYGVARSRSPVTVAIAARSIAAGLELTVFDDGAADCTDKPAAGTGTGVPNVCARLAARYGDAAECHSGPVPGGWLVRLVIPTA